MVFLISTQKALAVLATLSALASASPIERDAPGQTISLSKRISGASADAIPGKADLDWLTAHAQRAGAKYDATLKAFEANMGHPMPGSSAAVNANANRKRQAEALTDEQGGSFWQGSITIGSANQAFNMDFDTGSADLWVPSTSCSSCTGTKYNPSGSTTAKDQGRTFQISYGDGSQTSGEVYKDTVKVAGLTATGQGVGAASTVSSTTGASFDGLVGMAYQAISTEKLPPLFATLLSEGKVASGSFSFRLATSGSELYLGGLDSAKYSGSVTYTPVTQQAYWQVNMNSANANGQAAVSNRGAIIDTGTTVVYGPTSDVSAFYAKYPGATALSNFGYDATQYAGYYAVPCSGTAYASLTFGGRAFTIPTSIFTSLGNVGTKNGQAYCVGGFVGNDGLGLGTSWLVGDIFLQAVYTNFDLTNNRVGFATPK